MSREVLGTLYKDMNAWVSSGEKVLVHQEELGDRVMGIVAGYLLYSGRLADGAQAIAVVERLVGRQMGSQGREVVALSAPPRSGGSVAS
jgi:hypothetical protein